MQDSFPPKAFRRQLIRLAGAGRDDRLSGTLTKTLVKELEAEMKDSTGARDKALKALDKELTKLKKKEYIPIQLEIILTVN